MYNEFPVLPVNEISFNYRKVYARLRGITPKKGPDGYIIDQLSILYICWAYASLFHDCIGLHYLQSFWKTVDQKCLF